MSITGKTIVFTGKMSQTRAQMKKEAKAAGADVVSAISGEVDFLVCGDQIAHNATNAKYKKAKKLKIETIDEPEYRRRLTGKPPKSSSKNTSKNPAPKKQSHPDSSAKQTSIRSFYRVFPKENLGKMHIALEGKSYTTKAKIIDSLMNHSLAKVLSTFTSNQLKAGLAHLGKPTSGKKKIRYDRLLEALQPAVEEKSIDSKLLSLLLSGNSVSAKQGMSLFEALDEEEQKQILAQFPSKTEKGYIEWSNRNAHIVSSRDDLLKEHEGVKNHILNLGFVFHALANPESLKSIKSARIWLAHAMGVDFLRLVQLLEHAEIEFCLPQKNGSFSIHTQAFAVEVKAIMQRQKNNTKTLEVSAKHFPLISWASIDHIYHLCITGEPSEQKNKFSECLLRAERGEYGGWIWRNWYSDQRSVYSFSSHSGSAFPELKTLQIREDPIAGEITLHSPKLETVILNDLSSLTSLKIGTPIKSLRIAQTPDLSKLDINTDALDSYLLAEPLMNGISDAVALNNQKHIATHFETQNNNRVEIVEDATYGYTFTGKHAHIDHFEAWVETIHYEFSIGFFLDIIKSNMKSADSESIPNSRTKIWTEELDMEFECMTSSGYDLDYYSLADWSNRAVNTDPEIRIRRRAVAHPIEEGTGFLETLKQAIGDCLCYGSSFLIDWILEYFTAEELESLRAYYASLQKKK